MSFEIGNYGELKETVRDYLNKDDPSVIARIPTFIALGERKIFRQLRCPANERIATYTPAAGSGVIKSMQLPVDYLEAKLVIVDDADAVDDTVSSPGILTRISEQKFFLLAGSSQGRVGGVPRHFARVGNSFQIFPQSNAVDSSGTGELGYKLYYWADFSGQMVNDNSYTPILLMAPDLYLYAALLESQPFIKNDERIATWSAMFQGTMDLINEQRDEAEYSGSNVGVSNSVTGAYADGGDY